MAAAAVGVVLPGEPDRYNSRERGPGVPVEEMNPVWAGRAADAVARGDRPEDAPSVIPPLRRRARRE